MVMPERMPGTLSGSTTRENTWVLLQPRSSAASMSRESILTMTPYRGKII